MNGPIKIEPSAEQRAAAKSVRQMFVALVDEGFTEPQALVIIGHVLSGGAPDG